MKVGQEKQKDTQHYFYQPKPADVEMTAYVLLTYMIRDDIDKALPVVRWLTSQRNAYGGFSSTQVRPMNYIRHIQINVFFIVLCIIDSNNVANFRIQ